MARENEHFRPAVQLPSEQCEGQSLLRNCSVYFVCKVDLVITWRYRMFLKVTEAMTRLQLLRTAMIVSEDTVMSVVEDSKRDGNVSISLRLIHLKSVNRRSEGAVVRARSQVISHYQTTDD